MAQIEAEGKQTQATAQEKPRGSLTECFKHDNIFSFLRTIQELLGHKDVSTTKIYTHLLNKGGHGVRSPVNGL